MEAQVGGEMVREREREKEDSREDEEKRLCTTIMTIVGLWVCWVEKKEIVDLGLLTQTKISFSGQNLPLSFIFLKL